jgi:hypothetical protein
MVCRFPGAMISQPVGRMLKPAATSFCQGLKKLLTFWHMVE